MSVRALNHGAALKPPGLVDVAFMSLEIGIAASCGMARPYKEFVKNSQKGFAHSPPCDS
jgi:hypothetical protein